MDSTVSDTELRLAGDRALSAGLDPERDLLRARLFGSVATPARIGRYVVLRELGAGGMGRVYAAYDEQLGREVAVKVLRGAFASDPQHQQRLLREARALARLSNPHVVAVFEVGETEDSVFLAMELVAGQTLGAWRRDADRSWRETVLRYLDAGRGLAAAHAVGLVHRDFKPDNVLVGDDGRIRVVDFGLAYAPVPATMLSAEPHEDVGGVSTADDSLEARITRTGSRLGTPAYMSPEQLTGGTVGPASDQFSFCVSLHEALGGSRPFSGRTPLELLSNIMDDERSHRPIAGVPRWLDKLIAQGLHRDPDRRHASMEVLLGAISGRVTRRRRVGTMAIAGGLVIGGIVARPTAEAPCELASGEFAEVWGESQREQIVEASNATGLVFGERAAAQMIEGLDAYAQRWTESRVDACEATHVRRLQSPAVLDLRVGCLDRTRSEFVALTHALGRIEPGGVAHAAEAVAALPRVEACDDVEALARGVISPTPEQAQRVAEVRRGLAEARAVLLLGNAEQARRLEEPLLAAARTVDYSPLLAEALLLTGQTHAMRSDLDEAREDLLEAVDLAEAHRHDVVVADAWQELGFVAASRLREPTAAHRWLRRAEAATARIGDPPLARADLEELRGHVLLLGQQFDEAERAYGNASQLRAEHLGAEHVDTISAKASLASVKAERGEAESARTLYVEVIEALVGELGPQHPVVAQHRFNLARVEIALGQLDEAFEDLSTTRAIYEQAYGEDSGRLVDVFVALAQVEEHRGRLEPALRLAERARDLAVDRAMVDASAIAIFNMIGTLHFREHRWEASLAAFSQGHELTRAQAQPQKLDLAIGHSNIADALMAMGEPLKARSRYEQALVLMEAVLPADHELLAYPLQGLGEAAVAQGEYVAAVPVLRRALAIRERHPGDRAGLAAVHWALAQALGSNPTQTDAREHGRAAHEVFEELGDEQSSAEVGQWLEHNAGETVSATK